MRIKCSQAGALRTTGTRAGAVRFVHAAAEGWPDAPEEGLARTDEGFSAKDMRRPGVQEVIRLSRRARPMRSS